jgi:hypothetical protein
LPRIRGSSAFIRGITQIITQCNNPFSAGIRESGVLPRKAKPSRCGALEDAIRKML